MRDAGRRTLVACSGGADSSALAIAIACVGGRPVVGHVLHDLRPREVAAADRDAVHELAGRLGCEFVEAEVRIAAMVGNAEANARRARYAALTGLAAAAGARFVATGHQADDQLETLVMRLARGAGVMGLRGILATRELAGGVRLIRPALRLTHADTRSVCEAAGWAWREDATNHDGVRLRSALRRTALPELMRLQPMMSLHAVDAAEAIAGLAELVAARCVTVLDSVSCRDGVVSVDRARLVGEVPIVVGEAVRGLMQRAAVSGRLRMDRLSRVALGQVVRAVLEPGGAERRWTIGGVDVRLDRAVLSCGLAGTDEGVGRCQA